MQSWKSKCEKIFANNKRYFDCDTLEEWVSSEDFFEALWDYLREEIEVRTEHKELREVVEKVIGRRKKEGKLNVIDIKASKACGVLK